MNDDYEVVTARDIAEFLHHLAELRCAPHGPDPAERAAFLARKAELFTRIANQSARSHPDAYTEQVHQIAADARTAAAHARLELLPQQRVGPNQRRTSNTEPDRGGATSQEKSGASSG